MTDHLDREAAARLEQHLGLPAWTFDELGVGLNPADRNGPCWTFPERDGRGKVIGLMRRYGDGSQLASRGGSRGLFVPLNWRARPGPVFLVEGASDTLALCALELAVVGRPSCRGGVEYLSTLLETLEEGREIVVVGENDERITPQGPHWPGRDGARDVAQALALRCRREVKWTLPPEGSKDVRDWVKAHCAHGLLNKGAELTALLLARAEAAQPVEPDGKPLPLMPPEAEAPFPLDALPSSLRAFVEQTAKAVGCPASFVALPLLAVGGAALGNAWELAVTETHIQSAALFALVVGHPGSGKSPALQAVTAPLRELEQRAVARHRQLYQEWERAAEDLRGPAPSLRRLIVDDFTTEALAPLLADNPKGVLVLKDELAGLINALNQYRGGKGSDRQMLLSLWAGADLLIDRKKHREAGPVCVRRPFAGILGGIQPSVLERFRGTDRRPVVDDGLIDRFLFAYPPAQTMMAEDWSVLSAEAMADWAGVVERLIALQPKGVEEPKEETPRFPHLPRVVIPGLTPPPEEKEPWQPRRLVLSEEARPLWQQFTQRLAEEMNATDFPECLQGPWSKLRGYGARLALISQALLWGCSTAKRPPAEVSAAALESAAKLIEWFKSQVRKVHAILGSDARVADARRVLRWLAERPEIHLFTRREAWTPLRRSFPRPSQIDAPLALLVEHRYLTAERVGETIRYLVNPLWSPRVE